MCDSNYELINLYRENPLLWDPRVKEYRINERKCAVWSAVAKILKSTPERVQKRIKCLRTAYQKWKRDDRHFYSSPNGRARPRVYKYAGELSFLDPILVSKNASGYSSQVSDSEYDEEEFEPSDIKGCVESGVDLVMESHSEESPKASAARRVSSAKMLKSKFFAVDSRQKLNSKTCRRSVANSVGAGGRKSTGSEAGPKLHDDGHYAFAMMVYNQMKDMAPGPTCDLCRIKIQQVIMEFKYPQQLSQGSNKSQSISAGDVADVIANCGAISDRSVDELN